MAQRYSISSRPDEAAQKRKKAEPDKESKRGLIWAVLIIFGVFATGLATVLVVVVLYSNNNLKKENTSLKQQIEDLKKKNQEMSTQSTNSSTTPSTGIAVSKSTSDTVQNAVASKNYASLSSLFANSVKVTKAGSSTTTQTAAGAVASLSYLNGSVNPWNWDPSASTLGQYQSGPYGQYFADNTVVGTSSNGYVASFGVNSSGQIDTVFMSNNTTDVIGSSGQE